jgi:hypothetical protein
MIYHVKVSIEIVIEMVKQLTTNIMNHYILTDGESMTRLLLDLPIRVP